MDALTIPLFLFRFKFIRDYNFSTSVIYEITTRKRHLVSNDPGMRPNLDFVNKVPSEQAFYL